MARLWRSSKLPKKGQRGREEVVSAIGLDEGCVAGRFLITVVVNKACGQFTVLGPFGSLDELAHDGILSWVVATGRVGLVGREGIQVDPVLGEESVDRSPSHRWGSDLLDLRNLKPLEMLDW